LVALGTVADLVPLDRNNRVLVAQGLQRIRAGRTRPGITALFASAGVAREDATPADFGFRIAPQLNAAGRLDDMSVGIECLLAATPAEAERLAGLLADLNQQRRVLQRTMQADAESLVDGLLDAAAADADEGVDGACLYDASWHQGVVGLVASRVKDRLQRPVVAFADGEHPDVLKGSARSVTGVHIRDVLAAMDARVPGLIERFGGHAMAAGLSLRKDRLSAFRELFLQELQRWRHVFPSDDAILSDGELAPTELTLRLAELLRHSGPWGQAFPEPVFDGQFEVLSQRVVGTDHLKLRLRHIAGSSAVDAIAFNQPLLDLQPGAVCIAAFRLDVNDFRGRRSQQLVVEHIECV
jgi:single-stranded-DNA-specific exonuclease